MKKRVIGILMMCIGFSDFSWAQQAAHPDNDKAIEIKSFNAVRTDKRVEISWEAKTSSLHYFVLQQSSEGKTFTDIAIVFPNEDEHAIEYKCPAKLPQTPNTWYRILMLDAGGAQYFSPTYSLQ